MIVAKNVQVDVRGESLFENVSFVIRPNEHVGVVAPTSDDTDIFFKVLSGQVEIDAGTLAFENEKVAYISPQNPIAEDDFFAYIIREKPTFLCLAVYNLSVPEIEQIKQLVRVFKGGILIASDNTSLMAMVKTTRVFEIQPPLKIIRSYTGSYDSFLIEKEKNDHALREAYEKQQKEKRRLEVWLENKRLEASKVRSPEKGNTIRAKTKYLEREILKKEIPRPVGYEEDLDVV